MDHMLTSRQGEVQGRLTFPFLLTTVMLITTGLVALFTASYDKALRMGLSPWYFIERQVVFALMGVAAMVIIQMLPVRFIRSTIIFLLPLSLILMLLTIFTGMGETAMGATRWISIGPLRFQPSELVKVTVILFMANYFDRHAERLNLFVYNLYPACVIGLFALLILMQRDYSTTLFYVFVCFLLFVIAGVKFSYLLYLVSLVGIPGILVLFSESYRLKRVIGFLFKDIDPSGLNYQMQASLAAVASGGVLGKGLGMGTYKLGKIPEVQSDFVFAAFAEETGFVGASLVVLLFTLFGILGFRAAGRLRGSSSYLYYCGFGLTSLIVWQAFMNIGVVIGLLPPTGIPLPFFSQGGTSLLVNMGMSGLLLKIVMLSDRESIFGKQSGEGPFLGSDRARRDRSLDQYEVSYE